MSLKNKLEYLKQTKSLIKQSIIKKGVEVTEMDTFRSYASKIDLIGQGGGEDPMPEFQEHVLPVELSAGSVYSFQLPNKDILLSTSVSGIGLWVLKYETKEFMQVSTYQYRWNIFQVLGDYCLVSASSGVGLLCYDISNSTCTSLRTTYTNWTTRYIKGSKALVSSSATGSAVGLWEFDSSTGVFTQLATGYNWNVFTEVGPDKVLTASSQVAYIYTPSIGILTHLYTGGFYDGLKFRVFINDKWLCSTGSANSEILLYNPFDDSIEMIGTTDEIYQNYVQTETKVYFFYRKIMIYDSITETMTYTSGNLLSSGSLKDSYIVGDKILLLGSRIVKLDTLTDTAVQTPAVFGTWRVIAEHENFVFVSSTSDGFLFYVYDTDTGQLTLVGSSNSGYYGFLETDTHIFFTSNSSSHYSQVYTKNSQEIEGIAMAGTLKSCHQLDQNLFLLVMNSSTNTYFHLYNTDTREHIGFQGPTSDCVLHQINEDIILVVSTNGIYHYDIVTRTLEKKVTITTGSSPVPTKITDNLILSQYTLYDIDKGSFLPMASPISSSSARIYGNGYFIGIKSIMNLDGRTKALAGYYNSTLKQDQPNLVYTVRSGYLLMGETL